MLGSVCNITYITNFDYASLGAGVNLCIDEDAGLKGVRKMHKALTVECVVSLIASLYVVLGIIH